MHSYTGIAAPFVSSTPGAAGPGTIVVTGPSDPLGVYSTPETIDGGDPRSSANLAAASEANRDALNWCANHIIDFHLGGNWSAWAPHVTLGCYLSLENTLAVNGASGQNAIAAAGINAYALFAQSAGADCVLSEVVSGNGRAVVGIASGTGAGGDFTGGSTNGHGIVGTAGAAGGSGAKTVAAFGGNSLWASVGPIFIDSGPNDLSVDPGGNKLWANNIPRAWAYLSSAGGSTMNHTTGAPPGTLAGYGLTAAVVGTRIVLTMLHPPSDGFPCVTVTAVGSNVSTPHGPFIVNIYSIAGSPTGSEVTLFVWNIDASGSGAGAHEMDFSAGPFTTVILFVTVFANN